MLVDKIKNDLILALKEKNQAEVSILRLALSKIQNAEIDRKSQLTDEEVTLILKKLKQELEEEKEAAIAAKRVDLEQKTDQEINIILRYLPQSLSDQELEQEIKKIIDENKAVWEKNQKALIGICVKVLRTKAETKKIVKIINLLAKK